MATNKGALGALDACSTPATTAAEASSARVVSEATDADSHSDVKTASMVAVMAVEREVNDDGREPAVRKLTKREMDHAGVRDLKARVDEQGSLEEEIARRESTT